MKKIRRGQIQRGFNSNPDMSKAPDVEKPSDEDMYDQIEKELGVEGIVPFNNSNVMEDYLQLPADLTESTSKELGRYFNAFTQQKAWTRTLLGRVSVMLKELDAELDNFRKEVFAELPAKMSAKEKELHLIEQASDLIAHSNHLKSKKLILDNYLENLIDILFVVSREVSRREGDWSVEKRGHNIDNKRRH